MSSNAAIERFLAIEGGGAHQIAREDNGSKPTLLYLYGPPAAGKLTIAEKVAAISGYSLFHNHLTVNSVGSIFPLGSAAYTAVVHRMRLDVFARASQYNVNLIFTNNSAWRAPDARLRFAAFTEAARQVVDAEGGRINFVRVNAPIDVLECRLSNESRRANGKLLEVSRLRELLENLDLSPLHEDDFEVDTSILSADDAAAAIVKRLVETGCLSPAVPPED
jgi:hypothetical protein